MTPKEIWAWVDDLEKVELSDEEYREARDFFLLWNRDLYGELFQGRGVIANVSFKGGLLLQPEDKKILVYDCMFKNIVSAYPLQLA